MIRKRTIFALIVAAAAAAALLFPAADNALAAAPQSYRACNGHPGVEYGSMVAFECVYAQKGVGTLIWTVNLYEISYYWRPSTGSMVVAETFYRTCAQIAAEGAKCPVGLPLMPQNNGRLITLADGCLVGAPSQATVPTTCTGTGQGGQPGETKQMTTVEQASVAKFFKIMHEAVPLREW
jgi:hypothetical protein